MFSWTPYAFIRIALVYVAGVLLEVYLPEIIPYQVLVFVFGTGVVCFGLLAYSQFRFGKQFPIGWLGLVVVFFAGTLQVYHATDKNQPTHFLHYTDSIKSYQAVIVSEAQEKENSWKVTASLTAVHNTHTWEKRTGKVLLYFSKNVFPKPFRYGDVLLIEGSPQELEEPSNPGEFDYKRFLTFRQIYHQHFLKEGSVKKVGYEPSSVLMEYAYRGRTWADSVLRKFVHGEREQAIASALVLGVTDGLDNELLGAYAATGSMHVLAVSGLHVGIIYMLLLAVLKPLNRNPAGKWAIAVISLLVLWMYAFITGLSPSVLRAVTMFSFVALAKPWGQRTNIYNTLAASAFCLLVYEPYLIMSVGFQLSYLAVIGIVYLQPMLYRWWEPNSVLLDRIWQITCVSIAAQVATFSLGLLYFHQFPVYFLFSNLFVIPGSFAILVLGLAVIGISFISPLAAGLGFALEWIIRVVNWGVFFVEDLPYSLIDQVYITTTQCWLVIAAILCIFMLIEFRKFEFVILTTCCIVGFSIVQWMHFMESVHKDKFTVYKVSGQSAFDILSKGKVLSFIDTALVGQEERMRFHIRPNRLQSGARVMLEPITQHFTGSCLIHFADKKILHIYDKPYSYPKNLSVDFVVISRNAVRNTATLDSLKSYTLIFDSSNSQYFSEKMVNEMEAKGVKTYSVLHQGAFVANF